MKIPSPECLKKKIRELTLYHVSQELHDNIGQVFWSLAKSW